MLDKKFWTKTFKEQETFDISRRKIISESSRALYASKQAIFSLHRDEVKEAKAKLAEATKDLISLDKRFGKDFRLRMQGSWKAAVEEYVEASVFMDFYEGRKIGGIKGFNVEADEYIGGLSDLTGEILRKMIIWATKKEFEKVDMAGEEISNIVQELMKHNLTGYLRTKFDQSKKSLQKSESVMYDLSLRN
jgi:predicted translin family RNA/ssDNA-binding protein